MVKGAGADQGGNHPCLGAGLQENHALYQRLVAIRPSKDISRETLEAEHRQNELYRANCAQFKSPDSPKGKAMPASP
jgi:hypothetical protein